MVSGITCKEEHIILYNELKIEKKHRYVVLGLNDKRDELVLVHVGKREETLKDLEEHLPKDNCRFVAYDFEYKTFENPPRDTTKLLLICWAPDNAPIKVKVPFTSTKSELKSSFTGIQKDIQASDYSILDHEELRKECC